MQSYTDPCTMALESDAFLWELLNDAPGEIFDIPEMQDEKFDVEKFIEGDIDF